MKKLIMFCFAVTVLVSCGTSKVVKEAKSTFKGAWTLNTITYPGASGDFAVTLFNDTSKACFENSDWFFVANNNEGTYTITNTGCPSGERNFIWTIQEVNETTGNYDFLLKPVNEKGKSETGNTGFRVNLVSLTDTAMTWEQTVSLDGKPFTIRMNFNKK
ncbi:lipocalin family protein [Croceibacter atlanticus]|jgi:hypothetical protein|uniref:lipocalin family protein n=1 Tax=Croceibacter atlanticus TaxID=313588 RepID=UPI0024B99968|nr:lipocalin family protein [Croceibacter atlanticus]|tara:strand:+ start:469 stop:948 length:480 start_codon:yes stop_codon:yes gene_type:complete